jgi:hypothetical protein
MTRRSYRAPESLRWMSVPQIAAEIDRTPAQTQKLLDKAWFLRLLPLQPTGRKGTRRYPASAVEVLKAMVDVPHRPIPQAEPDWLSPYEGET